MTTTPLTDSQRVVVTGLGATTPLGGESCQKIRLSMNVLSLSLIVLVSWLTRLRMLGSTLPPPAFCTSEASALVRPAAGAVPVMTWLRCGRAASAGDSASLAWSAGVTSCGRGSPGRGGRSSALGGMVSGECDTILNSSGDTFLPPPRFSNMEQPPSMRALRATRPVGIRIVRRIVRPSGFCFCPLIMCLPNGAASGRALSFADK